MTIILFNFHTDGTQHIMQLTENSNSCISSAHPTIRSMVHSIVSKKQWKIKTFIDVV